MLGYVTFIRKHRPVLRAMAIENRVRPRSPEAARARAQNLVSHRRIADLILTRREEIRHADPEFATTFGLTAAFATSQELVLFADAAMHPLRLTDGEIAEALAASYLSLLAGPAFASGAPSPRRAR